MLMICYCDYVYRNLPKIIQRCLRLAVRLHLRQTVVKTRLWALVLLVIYPFVFPYSSCCAVTVLNCAFSFFIANRLTLLVTLYCFLVV